MVFFDTPSSRPTSSARRPASNCFNAPIISASLCLPFDITPLLVPQNHIHFPAVSGEQVSSPHVHLDYAPGRVTGWKMVGAAKQPIDVALDGRVWDGNLWGVTFAALPLKAGANYQLPVYQYDSGKGEFFVTVVGEQKVT